METILEKFGISGKMKSYRLITKGHINQTYLVKMEDGRGYILQHINSEILQNPHAIMQNIVKITEYLQKQNIPLQIPHFYQTAKGEYLFENWRIMDKIQGVTLTSSDNMEAIHSMGYAFGAFHQGLAEYPSSRLYDTFPKFHNTRVRFANLWNAVKQDNSDRACLIVEELEQLRKYEESACILTDGLQAEKFPMRVLHGDMKCSNVLFHPETFAPIAVIDLDTIMQGTILTDYGDAVRSLMGTKFSIEKYQAFERGYLESAQFLTDIEKEYFIPSAFCMTIELATRYAEDYFHHDRYFHANSVKRLRELLLLAREFTVF